MTREIEGLLDDGFAGDSEANPDLLAAASGEQHAICSPGEFERQHHALLKRQGEHSDDAALVNEAREFVVRGRAVGATQEDPRIRQHCQSILDYWAIFIYRAAQEEIDADLLPFDPALAPSLEDDQFPYQFEEAMGNRAQRMLGWRRLLDECERDLAGDHLLTVSWRPNGTTNWRLKRYQLISSPRLSSDGRLSSLKADLREPHGESTGDGQVLCNQQLTRRWLLSAADR